jgi:flagellar biosynthesis/type III secretory pathway ATPase
LEIEASVRTDKHRHEVSAMGKTIAEELVEQGWKKGIKHGKKVGMKEGIKEGKKEEAVRVRQQVLLNLLRKRFDALPQKSVAAIQSTKSVKELDAWLGRALDAPTLEDIGIGN